MLSYNSGSFIYEMTRQMFEGRFFKNLIGFFFSFYPVLERLIFENSSHALLILKKQHLVGYQLAVRFHQSLEIMDEVTNLFTLRAN